MTKMSRRFFKGMIYAFLIFLLMLSVVPFYLVMINASHSSFDIVTKLNLWLGDCLLYTSDAADEL